MSDIKTKIKEANNELRKAQNFMFNGKKDESAEMVKTLLLEADNILTELPDDFQAKQLKQKTEKLKKDLEKKGVSFGNSESAEMKDDSKPKEETNTKDEGLPSNVKSQLSFLKIAYDNKNLDRAKSIWELIHHRYKDKFDENHPEIVQAKKWIDKLKNIKKLEKEQAEKQQLINKKNKIEKEKRTIQSDLWLVQLRKLPHIGNCISEPESLREQQLEYKKALELFKSYNAETFEFGKTEQLTERETQLEKMLGEFPVNYISNANKMALALTETIKQRYEFLLNDQAWQEKGAPNNKPMIISQMDMNNYEEKASNIIALFSAETDASKGLIQQLAMLKGEDKKRRKIRAERTGMEPEVLVEDKETIETLAKEIVGNKISNVEILAVRVISKWNEKSEWVFTDTLQTNREYKTIKSLSVQVAAKETGGKAMLHTLHIESKLISDNNWSDIYGHIMWSNETLIDFAVDA